ncbi:PAS domain-containing protein, partial [Pseudomonas shirazensis]
EEDRARTRLAFQAVVNGEPIEQAMRHRIRWPDGSLHWLEVSGSLTHDRNGRRQMIGVIREITRQRDRETALINSEKRFASLFHMSPNAILLSRRKDGMLFEVNQHFEDMFGWPGAQIVGKTSIELGLWVHPEQRQQVLEATRYSTGPITMEVQFRGSGGKVHDGILCTQSIELEGVTFLLTTFVDTSERKRAELALKDSQERLDLAL